MKIKACVKFMLPVLLLVFCTAPCRAAVIAVNAGHQAKSDLEKEPIGPGSKILKYKVSCGPRGVASGMPEHELNLLNAVLLEKELAKRGHKVIMVRQSSDVNISNRERAAFALENGAELIINLHANARGARQPKDTHGAMTLCRSARNSFNPALYPKERKLAEAVQKGLCKATGAKNLGIVETDVMTGINWSSVPSVIVEVGYMTNETEDMLLQDEKYRAKAAFGIAEGIENYLRSR